MKAHRIVNLNEPLQVQELQTPTPKGTQVLVKVHSEGVCHRDVHVWKGGDRSGSPQEKGKPT